MGGSLELDRSNGRTAFVVTLAAAAAPAETAPVGR
jgi:hypothetical protein